MRFRNRHSNMTVFMAIIQGVIIGVAAVAVIGFIVVGTGDKKTGADEEETAIEKQPVSSDVQAPETSSEETMKLYARQNGAFSTAESASSFIAADSSLSTAAIIHADGQYFVWSAVGLTEDEAMSGASEESFKKEFNVQTGSCQIANTKVLHDLLKADDLAKIKSFINDNTDEKNDQLKKEVETITAFTSDLSIVRLHLLSQYSYGVDCVKIEF